LRTQILNVLVSRRAWMLQMLKRIEAGQISAATIGLQHRGPLLLDDMPEVRRRAAAVFESPIDENRERVLRQYRDALKLSGDVARGEAIFKRICATCHRASEAGPAIAPDLWALTNRSPENLLVGILQPNRAIDPRYLSYSAVTQDGRILSGMLVNEIGNAITLVDSQRKSHLLLRSELSELVGTGKSVMPEGLETEIPGLQGMADLLAYLSGPQPAP
jgi:putative heme-binding domain-containing protein